MWIVTDGKPSRLIAVNRHLRLYARCHETEDLMTASCQALKEAKDPVDCCRGLTYTILSLTLISLQVCKNQPIILHEVYLDAHGRTTRLVKHAMFLPHEIFGSLYATNHFDLIWPGAAEVPCQ